ncbi:DUF898 family protein [Deinococcus sp. LM3]|uniref:DUF898 family protein n=1 Tax=Deinococcus sp. LM3 TaxID=1938608 RepID=UPI0009C4F120|nr:DUF898 family protein [Deinococcus sp. LM3]OOV13348.1 hypothetical protein BXU09_00015 [Deinococcus sp. LM3]
MNSALTVVTLGLYLPWARVRNRSTSTGTPGWTVTTSSTGPIRAACCALTCWWGAVPGLCADQREREPGLGVGLIALLFLGLYPWLVAQSMRFQAVNTVHRGLRFHFDGRVQDAYVAYGAANVAAAVSGGLALPWAWFMQRRYQLNNLRYGSARGLFRGTWRPCT